MKRKLSILLVCLLGFSLLTAGCSKTVTGSDLMKEVTPAKPATETSPPPPAYIDAMSAFGWNLLRASSENEGNLLISPTSVHLALAMTVNGADKETRTQMLGLLAGGGLSLDALNKAARDALVRWNGGTDQDKLSIADSIWFDNAFTPDKAFLQANADYFAAAARKIDFRSADALVAINGWVKEATHGVIPTIVDEIPADAVMYLVNAIHFKADWAVPFETANTVKGVFHATGKDVEASFMNRSGKMQYLDDGGLTGVLLPYVGNRFAFFAILPGEGVTPRDMLGKLDNAKLAAFLKTLQANKANSTVDLALPKFETTYKDSLKNELVSMGMNLAFDDGRADFSLMNEAHLRNLFIGDVLHKTFCRVDEKGTEAAAVTAVVIKTTSMPAPGVQLKLDRPFLYGIVDLQTSVPMFVGILENPVG